MVSENRFFKEKKVLITGQTGFMGSWLTMWLTMLHANVCGYALDPPSTPSMYETLNLGSTIMDIRGDIRNTELLRKTILDFEPELIFHLAAQPIVLQSYDNPLETFDTNVNGTVNLLNEARKVRSVKSIIVVTSDKSYQNNEWVYPYRENDTLGGKDPYSASKSCQEIVINSFRESYFSKSSIGISSIRAGNVIGGGDWAKYRIVPDIVRAINNDEPVKIRNPDSVRPWQHVLEPISGMMSLAEKMYSDIEFSGAWNFGPDYRKRTTVRELVKTFIRLWGTGSYEIKEVTDSKESKYLLLDTNKSREKLNWFPHFNLEESIKNTVEWYKDYYLTKETIKSKTEKQINFYSKRTG